MNSSKSIVSGWLVYRIDRDGSALFSGVFPTKDKADQEASALHHTLSGHWYVTQLPLLDWELGGSAVSTAPEHRPTHWVM